MDFYCEEKLGSYQRNWKINFALKYVFYVKI